MNTDIVYTKSDFLNLFQQLNIKKGSSVCLQLNMSNFDYIAGGAETVIEALMVHVTSGGCVFMPTYTTSMLDPACLNLVPYERWDDVRRETMGYDKKKTPCDNPVADVFLKMSSVKRSSHPIYSFAYWGTYPSSVLKQSMDYPLSFRNVLKPLMNENAVNLIIGDRPQSSVMLEPLAKTLEKERTIVQRAIVRKGNTHQMKSFLFTETDASVKRQLLKMLDCRKVSEAEIYKISLEETGSINNSAM